jgi:hypothetical protein
MAKKSDGTPGASGTRARTRSGAPGLGESGTAPAAEVRPEQVAVRAYHIFLSRGATPGRELDDWLQAERELRSS